MWASSNETSGPKIFISPPFKIALFHNNFHAKSNKTLFTIVKDNRIQLIKGDKLKDDEKKRNNLEQNKTKTKLSSKLQSPISNIAIYSEPTRNNSTAVKKRVITYNENSKITITLKELHQNNFRVMFTFYCKT